MSIPKITAFFIALFVFLLAIKIFGVSYPVQVTTTVAGSSELSVVGEGKVEVVPDTAFVELGITVNKASSVEAAQSQINIINNAIIAAMEKLGIAKKDIKTSNYSIYPSYRYDSGVDTIDGYNGNVTVSVKSNPDQVATVIEEATKAGANQVNNTRFEVDDPGKYRAQARQMAIENAKTQAQDLANSLGIKLGKIVNVIESTPSQGGIMPLYARSDTAVGLGGGGPPAALEPGSQTITSVVTLYFEKK